MNIKYDELHCSTDIIFWLSSYKITYFYRTYCKYRFASYKNFDTAEEELVDILRKLKNQFDWRQYQKKWKLEVQKQEDNDTGWYSMDFFTV